MPKSPIPFAFASLAGLSTVAFAQSWASPVNGSWSEAAKWSPQVVPGAGSTVVLPFTTAYTVTQYVTIGIDRLSIPNPLGQLFIGNSNSLTLNAVDALAGEGSIIVQSDGSSNATGLKFAAGGTLSGGGTVFLNALGPSYKAYIEAATGTTLTNGEGRTIRGRGYLHGNWVNDGLVQADLSGGLVFVTANAQIGNNSVMRATTSGSLQFGSQTVTQSAFGRLVADNASSLYLSGTALSGGSVEILNGGYAQAYGTWSNVAPFGPFTIQPSQMLTIANPGLTHDGTITVQSDGSNNATGLKFAAGGTLSGGGAVFLNALGPSYKAYIEAATGTTLTNGEGRTIRGRGYLHGNWVNDGLVQADLSGGLVFVTANAQIGNNSVMRATTSGSLQFGSQTVTQSAFGRLVADNASSLYLSGTALSGGSVEILNGGYAQAYGTWSNVAPFGPFTIQPSQMLTIANPGLTHDGTITVQSDGSNNATGLKFAAGGTLSGGGAVFLNALGPSYKAYIEAATGTTLTNGEGRTIRGRGYLHGNWVNDGLVQADLSGGLVFVTANAQIGNNSVMRATTSGSLQFGSQTVTQSAFGRLVADNASSLYLSGTALSGGSVEILNGGYAQAYGTWSNVAPFGPFTIQPSQMLTIANPGLTHDGTITVQSDGSNNATGLKFAAGGTLSGGGAVFLNALGPSYKAYIEAATGTTLTNGEGRTIRGRGYLHGNWVNDGLVQADLSGGLVFVTANAQIGNNSVMRATTSGSLQFGSQTVTQSAFGRLVADNASSLYLSGTALSGGSVEILNGGYAQAYGTWSNVAPFGPFTIQPSQMLTIANPGLTHDGTITVQADGSNASTGLRFISGGTLGGSGKVVLNPFGPLHKAYIEALGATTLTHAAGRTLLGNGNIYGSWVNQGTITPGLTEGSVGSIGLRGPMVFGAQSVIRLDVLGGAAGQYDTLPGNSPLTLNGQVIVHVNGWNPTAMCSSVNLITASSISGKFSSFILDTPPAPAGMVWRLNYQPTRVALGLTCRPDLTGDCVVDDADFSIFVSSYDILDCADPNMAQDCPADLNTDGIVDDSDFVIFVAAYDELLCS